MTDEEIKLMDAIAIAILPEILKETGQLKYQYGGCYNILQRDCRFAYEIAEAMVQARSKSLK